MTMFTLPNFCRVCLKYDKNLIDLEHIENEPSETLMSKLQHCVSEVEWTMFTPLLCHPCIKRLNIAYTFKKQCVQSATVLKSYVALVTEAKAKESQQQSNNNNNNKNKIIKNNNNESSSTTLNNAYMMLPNQKYIKIVLGPQNSQNSTLQNVFLNVVPNTTTISPVKQNDVCIKENNILLNINNALKKFVPIAPISPTTTTTTPTTPQQKQQQHKENNHHDDDDDDDDEIINDKQCDKEKDNHLNKLLTESKSEELSVEIDPNYFNLDDDCDDNQESEFDEVDVINDWDQLIPTSQLLLDDLKMNGNQKFIPILPKTNHHHHQQNNDDDDRNELGQHFLSSQLYDTTEYDCETCRKTFKKLKHLRQHIKEAHMGKFPYQCSICCKPYAVLRDYENCMKQHTVALQQQQQEILTTDSLTLKDFNNDDDDYNCDLCCRQFNSSNGLLRHKVVKHNEKNNKKKYFIKGMKNAKCDICNREFSTQSYMQLHRKLHLRNDIGYRYKVFGKSKYNNNIKIDDNDDDDVNNDHNHHHNNHKTNKKYHHHNNDNGNNINNQNDDNNDRKMDIDDYNLVIDEDDYDVSDQN